MMEESPLMPSDGTYGWRILIASGVNGLKCFRVVADEDIGKGACSWSGSETKLGEAYFARDPKRPNAYFFCLPLDEPDIAAIAEAKIYSPKPIRVILVEPSTEPPNLMK